MKGERDMVELRDKYGQPYEGIPSDDSVEVEGSNIKYLVIAVTAVVLAICVVFAL